MKRVIMKTFLVVGVIMVIWLILAQSCMSFRVADDTAKKKFTEKGVTLTTNTITVNKRSLHYAQTGANDLPTIIFVHGTPGSWNAFEDYLKDKELQQKFRLISIDRPGFGNSNFGSALKLADQSLIISPLLDYIKNDKPVYLVGHSLGGPMIIKLGADNPGKINALVLLAASNDPAAEKAEKWRPVLYKTPLKYFIPGALRPSNEELWYLKTDLVDLKEDFKKIICPVYIVHGKKDVLVPFSNVAYSKKMLENNHGIEELIFENENHFIPWTRYEEIKALLLKLN
jgi:pimeloyl-ACP methyl ester carboxylesterase